jgi:ABC-type transport system substrate-binding protein
MSFTYRWRYLITAFVALLLTAGLLTGCNNNPYPLGESAGNVLYRTLTDDPKSLDPTFTYTLDEAYIADLIYPSFYKYEYLKRPFQITLNLGAKEPFREKIPLLIKQPDGTTKMVTGERYTFTLRNDLKFQDDPCFPGGKGRPITAQDVVYSFKRMTDSKIQCPVASFFADKVLSWEEYSKGFDKYRADNKAKSYDIPYYDNEMAGVQVDPHDPYTFTITLTQPYPQLKYLMAMHFTGPQAREAVKYYGEEYPRHPVGCGPYVMSEYKPKQRIVLVKNPNRHKAFYPTEGMPEDEKYNLLADAGKELPRNDKVVFSILKEGVTAWNLFQQGYLDAAGVGNANYQQVVASSGLISPDMASRGITLRKDAQVAVYYLAFNMEDPVFGGLDEKHRKLRQAVSLGIDQTEYIELLAQGNGIASQWIIPPGVNGNDPDYKNPYMTGDVEKAKKLLAEAGYPDGIDPKTGQKLVLHYDNTAINAAGRIQVGIVQKQIERIGIKVESRSTPPNVFQDKLLKGQHQMIFYGWFADYPDPENFVFLLYGPNKKPGPNSASYKNPEYDQLFDQMKSMDDGPERMAIIKKMRDISVEDCPWIYVFNPVTLSVGYDWMKNVKAHPIANDYNQYRSVDFEKRTQKQFEWNQPNVFPLLALIVAFILGAIPAVGVVRNRVNRRVRRDTGAEI